MYDSDFNDDESSSDDEEVHVAKERRGPTLKAPERKAPKAAGGAGGAAAGCSGGAGGGAAKAPRAPRAARPLAGGLNGAGWGKEEGEDASTWDGGLRKSSRSIVKEIRSKSETAREKAKAKPAPRRNLNAEPIKPLTQAEILAEAALTEVRNLADLERMLKMEEATKKKAERHKINYNGAVIRIKSSGPTTTMELRFGARIPPPLGGKAPKMPPAASCVITGKPAKYRDPLTGQPYVDAAAFKELRRRRREGEGGEEEEGGEEDDGGGGTAAGAAGGANGNGHRHGSGHGSGHGNGSGGGLGDGAHDARGRVASSPSAAGGGGGAGGGFGWAAAGDRRRGESAAAGVGDGGANPGGRPVGGGGGGVGAKIVTAPGAAGSAGGYGGGGGGGNYSCGGVADAAVAPKAKKQKKEISLGDVAKRQEAQARVDAATASIMENMMKE